MMGADFDALAARGSSYTLLDQDAPAACGGVMSLWPGVAVLWGVAGELKPLSARLVRRQVAIALQQIGGVRRLEATARVGFSRACALLDWLGFERQALLDGYGADGADYWLYRRRLP